MITTSFLIIGTGLAGYTLAKEIRAHDSNSSLTLITADDGVYYSKPMLSNALAQKKTYADLALKSASTMATQLNADIHTNTSVLDIDAEHKQVRTQKTTFVYDKLILAVGAKPISLPWQHKAPNQIKQVNTLAEYEHFQTAVQDREHITVLGAGLIGCEFAHDLASAGKKVTLLANSSGPLTELVPLPVGQALATAFTDLSIDCRWNTSIVDVESGEQLQLQLDTGASLTTEGLLVAIGIKPNLILATQLGLQTRQGIVVDRYLQTSEPHIYALGDCAEVNGLTLPYINPLNRCAQALAQTLTGTATQVVYPAMPVNVKTPTCPIAVFNRFPGTWQTEGTGKNIKALQYQNDQLVGFAVTGSFNKEKTDLMQKLPPLLS